MRSNIGYFDTDCGIITLALAVTLFFIHFGIDTTKKRYLYIFQWHGSLPFVLVVVGPGTKCGQPFSLYTALGDSPCPFLSPVQEKKALSFLAFSCSYFWSFWW